MLNRKPTEETRPQADTVIPQNGNTQRGNTVKNCNAVKIRIYPSEQQLAKIYDLMEAYRTKTGVRIKQQDLIRRIIDAADIKTILP